jgi:hypothetical protein
MDQAVLQRSEQADFFPLTPVMFVIDFPQTLAVRAAQPRGKSGGIPKVIGGNAFKGSRPKRRKQVHDCFRHLHADSLFKNKQSVYNPHVS